MGSILRQGLSKLRSDGVGPFLRAVSNYIRNYPRSVYVNILRPKTSIRTGFSIGLNGVTVHPHHTFDWIVPWTFVPSVPSEVEAGAVNALQQQVQKGDTVVVVGGGRGVTAVHAARNVGSSGSVIVYEGSGPMVEQVRDTVTLNDVGDSVTVKHEIVGSESRLYGPRNNAEFIDADTLPECDVLEMDCEGAETAILSGLNIQPRCIIVETHGNLEQVRDLLTGLGYEITWEAPAETRVSEEQIEEWGLYTVVAE